jgi:Coenzyme PQQ synthesis protein D (PqqD)
LTTFSAETIIQRKSDPLTAEVNGEVVMLDVAQGTYFALGSVGSQVWALLERPRSLDQLCEELVRFYEVDIDTCRLDVIAFLDELQGAQLIDVRS